MSEESTRRRYLRLMGAAGLAGVAGCSQSNSPERPTETELATSTLGGANFTFEYDAQQRQVTVRFNGGAQIAGGNLEVRSSGGPEVAWTQLGSTVAGADERLSEGATAVLGEGIINWGQPVSPGETIRLVFVGGDGPATLGRFTPPASSTLTSTVPSTETPASTETPPADTTAPSISAFSLSNPSGRELRTAFESDEPLATIQVRLTGAEAADLTTAAFSETVSGGTYTYEATYEASTDGDYTATLDEAADGSGNDGASGQSVTVSVSSASLLFEDTFDDGEYTDTWEPKPGQSTAGVTVTESGGYLTHDYDSSSGGGNLITIDAFDATGTVRMTSRLRPTTGSYSGFGQVLSFGPDGQAGGVGLAEDIDEGLSIRAWATSGSEVELDSEPMTTGWREYSFTVDFENEVVTRAARGSERWDIDIDIGQNLQSTYVLEIGNGVDHDVEYDYVRLESV